MASDGYKSFATDFCDYIAANGYNCFATDGYNALLLMAIVIVDHRCRWLPVLGYR